MNTEIRDKILSYTSIGELNPDQMHLISTLLNQNGYRDEGTVKGIDRERVEKYKFIYINIYNDNKNYCCNHDSYEESFLSYEEALKLLQDENLTEYQKLCKVISNLK